MKKRILLITCILIGLFVSTIASADYLIFKDINSESWYASSIKNMKSLGIMNGDKNGYFRPKDYVTRAELAIVSDKIIKTKQSNIETVVENGISSTVKVVSTYRKSINMNIENVNSYIINSSVGSGFFIDSKHIITNQHVVEKADGNVDIILPNGRKHEAKIINQSKLYDLALLKVVSESNFHYLKLTNDVKMGEDIITIGHLYSKELGIDLDFSVSKGIVSSIFREIKDESTEIPFYQADISVNSGNSGGAAINKSGEVIGVIRGNINNLNNVTIIIPSSVIETFYKESKK